jgi:hypothetical protein
MFGVSGWSAGGFRARMLATFATALGAVALCAGMAWGQPTPGSGSPPPPLTILAASIDEVPPLTWLPHGRDVVFTIELDARPDCAASPRSRYGFLIVLRPQDANGSGDPLGADARIVAECRGGRLVAPRGKVRVSAVAGGTGYAIRIAVPIERLPAQQFGWAAFASDGAQTVRMPQSPKWAGWAVWHRRLY